MRNSVLIRCVFNPMFRISGALFWFCFSLLFILTLSLLASSVLALIRDLRLRCKGKTKGFFWLLFEIAGVLVYIICLAYLLLKTKKIENPEISAVVNFVSADLVLPSNLNHEANSFDGFCVGPRNLQISILSYTKIIS